MTDPRTVTTIQDLPLGRGVQLLNHNEDGLVALDKPAGLMAHPNKPEDRERSLLNALYDYENEEFQWRKDGKQHRAWLINRIDSPTSGVILVALNKALAETIQSQFASHRVTKTYFALVKNVPRAPAAIWDDQLRKDVYRGNKLIKGGQRVPAKTRYQLVRTVMGGFPVALLRLSPVTGRTHQLRVQCKKHGHPIVGDRTYGSFSFNREVSEETGVRRMLLHSAETTVRYAHNGVSRHFNASSPLPEAFNEVLRFRPGLFYNTQARAAVRAKSTKETGEGENYKSTTLEGRRFKDGS